jgi:ribosome maturation factor RimP
VSELVAKIEQLVTPLLEEHHVELVDLTYQKSHAGWTLSLYLDKAGGITLDDCANWSDRIGTMIDAENIIDRSYVLEVASPGLDRALRKLKDFEKFAGQKVHAKLFAPMDGQKNFHGVLLGADESVVRIELEDHRQVSLPRTQIAKCRLNPVIDF